MEEKKIDFTKSPELLSIDKLRVELCEIRHLIGCPSINTTDNEIKRLLEEKLVKRQKQHDDIESMSIIPHAWN